MTAPRSKWSDEGKKLIFEAYAVMATIQKTYGREFDPKDTLRAWEYVMASDYTPDQVVWAIDEHMKKSDEFPTPANLIALINPPAKKISEYEYRQAYKQWELSGFPPCSYEWSIVNDYRNQNEVAAPRQFYKVLSEPEKQKGIYK